MENPWDPETVRHWLLRKMYQSRLHKHAACEAYVYVTQENDKKIIGINLGVAQRSTLLRTERNPVAFSGKM